MRRFPLLLAPISILTVTVPALLAATVVAAQEPAFRFEDVTATHLPDSPLRNSMDVGVADLDGDGDLDVVIPQEFRVNKLMLNDGAGRFTDISDTLPPLSAEEMAGGPASLQFAGVGHDSEDVSIADFDGDGVLDLIIVTEDDVKFGRRQVHEYYLGLGGGRFDRVEPGVVIVLSGRSPATSHEAEPAIPDMEADAVAHADVDGDGDFDVLIAGAGQDRLLMNDGKGGFGDFTSTRLPTESLTTQDAEFADLDGDGDVDIVLGQEGGHALWENVGGSGYFMDASDRLPAPGNVEARKVTPADVDGDGDLDLYFSHVGWQERSPQDQLYINDGTGRFTDETAARIPVETRTTLVARFADLDGDGDLDVVRGEHGPLTIWANDGRGVFTDVTDQVLPAPVTGVNIAVALADFDGDGRIDIYVGQLKARDPDESLRDRLLLNRGS